MNEDDLFIVAGNVVQVGFISVFLGVIVGIGVGT